MIHNNRTNPLMQDDVTEVIEETNGWKARAEKLQEGLDQFKAKEASAKALCDSAIAMLQKSEEMFNSKDFRTVFAIAETQGFPYKGPLIKDAGMDLVKAVQAFQVAWKTSV